MTISDQEIVLARRNAGVTLIELLTVLAIMAIMLGLAAPSMTGVLGVNRAEAAANQVAADLMYARVLAVRSGGSVTVTYTPTSYEVATASATDPAKVVDLSRDYVDTTIRPSAPQVIFNSRGLVTVGTGDFSAISGDKTAAFTLTGVGGIQRDF
ncbi:MAG TPA: GspH/FimT family pseudopilin [Longimicrobiaceae bacterium]|nr:GspH/FimT family pseudopilin [Longimicrobiaceae bacterium]